MSAIGSRTRGWRLMTRIGAIGAVGSMLLGLAAGLAAFALETPAAQAAGSPTAAALWADADRQFTDQAAAVNLVTPSITDFVPQRVGNYEYNPQLGVLLDQLWVR